jgi:WD40 repeat protein/DNA-binding SARP family transcriptional activator
VSSLEVRLLGPFQVRLGERLITEMRSDKVRALLAYLAVEADQPHRREKLAGLLWPGYPEDSARASLRRALADLRVAIEDERANPPYLQITRQTIQFDRASTAWVDVTSFNFLARAPRVFDEKTIQDWEAAVDLYRGDFMEGFSLADCPAFEEWALLNREHAKRRMLETLGRLVEAFEARGDYMYGLAYAWRSVELDPLRESAHRGLMRLQALQGEREAALAQYAHLRQVLAGELGVEPALETQRLYEQIFQGAWPPVIAPDTEAGLRLPRSIGACPYRGLAAFREQDQPFFFGREHFVQQLLDAVRTRRMAAVIIGSSGSGKSSVVAAGLIPVLRSEGDWRIVELRPGADPFHALAAALLPLLEPDLSESDSLIESQKLASVLNDGTLPLHHLLDRIQKKPDAEAKCLLFIDQFEELYTLCQEPEIRHIFLARLQDVINVQRVRRDQRLALLLTMRADFMGQALSFRPFADLLQSSAVMLGPMRRDELRAAIEKPAAVQGAAFEDGLVERILDDVGSKPGNLPLLEFALTLLWDKAQTGWLTHDAYDEIGKVAGALARQAEQVYSGLDDSDCDRARRVFLQLVQPGEGTEDTRRIATRAEIGDQAWTLVQHLADQRLVVTGRDTSGVEIVEIVHEALIGNWERLQGWIENDRAFRTWQEGLRNAIRQWEASDEDQGALLRGAVLVEAEGWLETHSGELSRNELHFINLSILLRERQFAEREQVRQRELQTAQQLASAERRRRKILLALAVVLSLAVVVASILTVFSLQQRQAALEAYSASLAVNAQKALDAGDHATALALALVANAGERPALQAQRVLLDVAYAPGARQRFEIPLLFPGATSPASAIALAPDGKTTVLGLADGKLIIWELGSAVELVRLEGHTAKVNDIAIDPSGRWAVSVGDDAQVIVWDLLVGVELHRLVGHSGPVRAVDISREGGLVVTGGFSASGWEQPGELMLWDLQSGDEIRRFTGHVAGVVAAKFCLDDQALLVSSGDAELFSTIGTAGGQAVQALERDLLLWDVEHGEIMRRFDGQEHDAFTLSISPDGKQGMVGSYYEGLVSVYDLVTGDRLARLEGHEDTVRTVSFGKDGRTGLSGSADGRLILWDIEGGKPNARLAVHGGDVLDIDISPDGRFALSTGRDSTLILWDLVDAAQVGRFDGHGDMVYDVGLVPAQGSLLSGSGSGSVNRPSLDSSLRLWQLESGALLNTYPVPLPAIFQVAISPDGKTALYVGGDVGVHILDLKTWQESNALQGHQSFVTCIEFLPDGSRALSGSGDGTLILWDLQSGQLLYQLDALAREPGVWALAISPDGSTALSDTGQGSMILWDLQRGELLRILRGPDPDGWTGASGIAYRPDGTTALSVGGDGRIIEWDLESGQAIRQIGEHPGLRTRVVVTPDGRLAMTAGMDGALMLWDLETGRLIRRSEGHGVIFDLTLSADGETVFFGSSDTTIILWRLSNPGSAALKEWIKENRYVRPLSCAERELYRVEPLCEGGK